MVWDTVLWRKRRGGPGAWVGPLSFSGNTELRPFSLADAIFPSILRVLSVEFGDCRGEPLDDEAIRRGVKDPVSCSGKTRSPQGKGMGGPFVGWWPFRAPSLIISYTNMVAVPGDTVRGTLQGASPRCSLARSLCRIGRPFPDSLAR